MMALPELKRAHFDKESSLTTTITAQLVSEAIGPLFIGFIVSAALYGVLCAQACLYFKRHSQDSTRLKSIITILLILETLDIILVTHGIFVCAISEHGTFLCFHHPPRTIVVQILPTALIVAIVQYVWVMRIRTLSHSKRKNQLVVSMLFLIFTGMGMSITLMGLASKSPKWGVIQGELWPVVASFALRAFNDLSLTGFLCYYLQHSKTGILKTDSMIQKMIGYGLRAGLFNSMGSIATMASLIVIPRRLVYMGIYLSFARVYTNSLLAMLNWRRSGQTSELAHPEVLEGDVELSTVQYWGLPMSSRARPLTIPELENM